MGRTSTGGVMPKFVRISKWGASIGVRIPRYIVDNLDLKAGDLAELSYQGNRIIIDLHKAERPKKLKTPAEKFEEQVLKDLHDAGVPGY